MIAVIKGAGEKAKKSLDGRGTHKYPFGELGVGDGFIVDEPKRMSAVNSAAQWARVRGLGHKFSSAKQPDGGVLIWRTA